MSQDLISLQDAKDFLDVFHSSDDSKIQSLLDSAVDEACLFIGYSDWSDYYDFLTSSENTYPTDSENPYGLPYAFKIGALLLAQSNYQATPDDISKLRKAAEVKLMPLRVDLGI
jgi:hypothetical protein